MRGGRVRPRVGLRRGACAGASRADEPSGVRDGRAGAIAFRCADQPLGQALAAHAGAPFHLAGRLQPRHGGDTLQLIIDDAAPALGG